MKCGGVLLILGFVTACWTNNEPPKTPTQTPEAPKLTVDAVAPRTGDAAGGTLVRIRGPRFMADGARHASVYTGDRPATVMRSETDTELLVKAPAGTPDDVVDVRVSLEPGGELTLSKAFTFTWEITADAAMAAMGRFAEAMCA